MWKTNLIAVLTSSLQRKLMLALMAIVTVVIGAGGIYLLSSQQQSASAGLEARAVYMASMLSKTLAGPLWNMDLKSIQDQLDMAMSDPEIYSVALYQGKEKQPLALKKRDGQAIDGIEREAPVIYVRDPSHPPVELGKVHIVYTLTYMYQAVEKTRTIILTGLLLLIASLFAATYVLLRQMVEKPIQELLAIVHRITNGDFEAKMPVRSGDEIGLLSEGVNYMTDKLKQTMDSLIRSEQNYRTINETLESSVQERTAELHGRTIELQKHIEELDKVRKDTLNILEDLEVSRKVTEATMQKIDAMSQEQTAIFESLTLGIAFIKDRIILRGNAKLGELFGRPLDEMVGQTTRIWYKNEEEYSGIGASTYEDLKRQPIHQREQELPRKDGSLFWCLFRVRALDAQDISQGIVCTLEDITERRQAQRALAESEKRLEMAMWSTNTGLWEWNAVTGELVTNATWSEMLGYDRRELDEKYGNVYARWEQLTHPEDLPAAIERLQAHIGGKIPEYRAEFRMKSKSGEWIWILDVGKGQEPDANGKPTKITGTHVDITERKQAEVERNKRMEELEQFMRLTINREKQMIQLKAEINKLLQQTDKEQKYKIVA